MHNQCLLVSQTKYILLHIKQNTLYETLRENLHTATCCLLLDDLPTMQVIHTPVSHVQNFVNGDVIVQAADISPLREFRDLKYIPWLFKNKGTHGEE